MKTLFLYILGILVSYIPVSAFSMSVKNSDLKIAYVSINETVSKTGEQKKITKSLEAEKKRIQNLIRKKSKVFNKQVTKIRQEMGILSEAEKVKKYESMQKMQMMMEKFVKEKELAFQKKESQLRNKIGQRIKIIINQVAKKEKVDIIRQKDGILWVTSKVDLTNKVISLYKKKYK